MLEGWLLVRSPLTAKRLTEIIFDALPKEPVSLEQIGEAALEYWTTPGAPSDKIDFLIRQYREQR